MNYCIYRNINNCKSCNFKAKKNYCNLHNNNRNIIYEIINNSIYEYNYDSYRRIRKGMKENNIYDISENIIFAKNIITSCATDSNKYVYLINCK